VVTYGPVGKQGRRRSRGARLGLAAAALAASSALLPAGASAAVCGDDGTTQIFDSGGYYFDFTMGSTTGADRNQPFAALYDSAANGPAGTPPGPRSTFDTYDEWGALFVGGDGLANLYHSNDNNSCTDEDGGREHVYPVVGIGGLQVQRKIFVPATGMPGARILNLITNPGSSPVMTSVQVGDTLSDDNEGDLGSDTDTAVRSSSSGDAALTPADFWGVTSDSATTNSDLALAHVIDGPGGADRIDSVTLTGTAPGTGDLVDNLMWRWDGVTIPPGGTAAFLSFEVQQGVAGASAPTENANAATQAVAYQTASPATIYTGMSEAEIAALRNWNDLEVQLELDAKGKQKVKKLKVDATCPEEGCTVDLSGKAKAPASSSKRAAAAKSKKFKLKPKSKELAGGQTETITLKLKKAGKLRNALEDGGKSKLKLTAGATDAAGSTSSETAKIKLKP